MINAVNSVNSKYENVVETTQTQSTTQINEEQSIEEKVYKQASEIKDTVELSESGKGLNEDAIRSMRDAMNQNRASIITSFVSSANSAYKSGISAEDFTTLADAYNTQKYLLKNAFKMYYGNKDTSKELDEINDLKNQIAEVENQISGMEKDKQD